jgi:hypothetical protein
VDQAGQPARRREPPSFEMDASFPAHAFGYGTLYYHAFLQALLDGLLEYKARKGDSDHAPSPLPAA